MKRHWIAFFVAVIVCGLVLWQSHESLLIAMARWLDVGETPRKADYVMVLPGGPEQRPFVAVAMVRAGLAKAVLTAETVTDVSNTEGLIPVSDAILRQILLLRGLREDQIQVLPGQSNSTWTDAQALARFLQDNPDAKIAVVTHDYHTRRSRWVFQRVLGPLSHNVCFVSAPVDRIKPDNWWKTEQGLSVYLSEYSKLMIYVGSDSRTILIGLGLVVLMFAVKNWPVSFKKSRNDSVPVS